MDANAELLYDIITEAHDHGPRVVGICGPQGCGKSTLARCVGDLLAKQRKLRVDTLSLDDYYLPHDQQRGLYERLNDPLYEFRGNPGTHDVALLEQHLRALKNNLAVHVPVYDKLACGGRGDRVSTRPVGPCDVVLLEGWMLGFAPQDGVAGPLHTMNRLLREYEAVWELVDHWIWLQTPNMDIVYEWRWEQEASSCGERNVPCRSRAEIRDFVSRFMPAYRLYYQHPPTGSTILTIHDDRRLKKC